MGSKTSNYDEELSNGESSKGNDTSMIVNVNDTQSDIEDQEESNYTASEDENEQEQVSEHKESSSKKSKSENSSSKKKSPAKESKSRSVKVDPTKTRYLWASGIPAGTQTGQLEELFSTYGKVLAIKIIRGSGSSLLGFVKLETIEQAQKCMDKLNKTEFRGSKIELFKERPGDKEDRKCEKIGFRDSRKFSPRTLPPVRRPAFRPSIRGHFRGTSRPSLPRIRSRTIGFDLKRQEREESMRLERERQRLKLERMKLERDKAELLKFERESRTFDSRDRVHDDKRIRSMVKRPIEDSFIDDKRYDDYNRRDDFSRRFESRTSPDRKISSNRSFGSISARSRYEDTPRQDRFSDNKYDSSKSWSMSDSSWMAGGDRWQSSSNYDTSRMLSSTINSGSISRLHSNSDLSQNMSSRGYFGNNRRY